MKIFMVCAILLDGRDAQTIHILEVFKNLAKLSETHLFAPNTPKSMHEVQNIIFVPSVMPIFKSAFYQIFLLIYLSYYCFKLSPDVIYSRHSSLSFSPFFISKIFQIPYVVEVNGLIIDELKMIGRLKLYIKIVRIGERLNYKQAKKIVAVTQGVKEGIEELYNIPDEKIVVIENGANADLFKPMDQKEARKELNLNENYNYVGFSGSFNVWHGIKDLVKSAPLILKEVKNTKFILVGDGELKEQIIQMVNDLNLTDNFIFINRVPYEEVPKYVNAFDVCVILKKKDIPGSPLKLWEYMACGKPVVATNTQDFKALEEYNAGILVDPEKPEEVADAIITLLKNKELREEMGNNGRKYVVENRSWESVAREVVSAMKEAVK